MTITRWPLTYMDKSGRNTIKCSEYYVATTMDNTTVLDTMTAAAVVDPFLGTAAPYSSKMPDAPPPLLPSGMVGSRQRRERY